VGFVAIAGGRAVVATKPSCGVGFVSLARRWVIGATKPTRPPAPQPLYPAPLTFAGIQTTARR
jgi:hypothetical protein